MPAISTPAWNAYRNNMVWSAASGHTLHGVSAFMKWSFPCRPSSSARIASRASAAKFSGVADQLGIKDIDHWPGRKASENRRQLVTHRAGGVVRATGPVIMLMRNVQTGRGSGLPMVFCRHSATEVRSAWTSWGAVPVPPAAGLISGRSPGRRGFPRGCCPYVT